jgi:hypothetical protein
MRTAESHQEVNIQGQEDQENQVDHRSPNELNAFFVFNKSCFFHGFSLSLAKNIVEKEGARIN